MMVIDHGAIEASSPPAANSDVLLTPDFRILIGGPGAADVKVRLGQHGDTCVDNAGVNAPYVLVTSVFDGSIYRVQPGQRVMFQHGSIVRSGGSGEGTLRLSGPRSSQQQRISRGAECGSRTAGAGRTSRCSSSGHANRSDGHVRSQNGAPPPDTDTITSTSKTSSPHVQVAAKKPPKRQRRQKARLHDAHGPLLPPAVYGASRLLIFRLLP